MDDCYCRALAVDLPYPEVDPAYEPRTVLLLKEDYAGGQGELTASSQYIYQHILTEGKLTEFADVIFRIGISEMHHIELLGETILNLGGDPVYESQNRFWNAGMVNYVKEPRRMLIADINDENTAIRNYRRHIQMIANPQVKALLERIIMDEELHIKVFTDMLNRLDAGTLR